MYKLHIASEAEKEIKKIKKLYQESVVEALKEIVEDPLAGKPLNRELTNYFAYKIGPFRIIYRVNSKDKIVEVVSAGHRETVYN